MPSRRVIVIGSAFLVAAGGGFALMGNGLAAADTTKGEVSVQCRYSVFEDPEQSGREARGEFVNFEQRVPITLDDNGQIIRSSQVYDLDVASAGVAPSSFYVSCNVSSNVADSHWVSGTIARLYQPPAGPGDSCGAGQGRIEEYSEVSVSSAAAIPMTLFENSLPRDLPECNDNLARIGVKFEILA
jgi:hypothetical protein